MTITDSKTSNTINDDKFQTLLSELSTSKDKTLNYSESIKNSKSFTISSKNCKFFRISELSLQEQFLLRQDLETVFASFTDERYALAYFISGKPSQVEIYIGVIEYGKGDSYEYSEVLYSQLNGNISGIKLERINAEQIDSNILQPLSKSKYFGLVTGLPSLTIDQQAQSQGKSINQGIDRLARTLIDDEWQMLIIAEPTNINQAQQYLEDVLELSSQMHPHITQSTQIGHNTGKSETTTKGESQSDSHSEQTGTNESNSKQKGINKGRNSSKGISASKTTGSSENDSYSSTSISRQNGDSKTEGQSEGSSVSETDTTGKSSSTTEGSSNSSNSSVATSESSGYTSTSSVEQVNNKLKRIADFINDKHISRLEQGLSNGLFRTAIYICSKNNRTYDRLSSAVMAIFTGNQSYFNPLTVQKVHLNNNDISQLFKIQWQPSTCSKDACLIQSTPYQNDNLAYATWLNSSELSLLAGLPSREVCGIRLRKNVDFSVNPSKPSKEGFELGKIILNGRKLEKSKVSLDKKLLNQHIFISGVTGAGKTTTCQQLLLNSKLPFLVIEPAKTEYRSLYSLDKDIQYYTLNNEKISPFRFNPFELLPSEQILSHIDILKATFSAVFPMEASMPYLIEEAIVRSYEAKGWDIHTSENLLYPKPWDCGGEAFPIISEMLIELDAVIASKGFGMELQEKYRGSLISRLDNLTIGSKGRMLNTRRSINILALLEQKVVIELDELKDEQDKALIMGLLIGRVAEAMKYKHSKDHTFRHLTLVEEAHRLLEKPQMGEDGAKRMGINLFANMLAEVRKYGEGLIIADQIPNKLVPEVLKNTNTKIIHRLFAIDDRKVIGETVGLDDEQVGFLPMLHAGEAVVYSAGWHGAVRMQVNQINDTNDKTIDESIIIKHSQRRIFKEREYLYPSLSKIKLLKDAKLFFRFIQEGSFILNMWVKWYHLVHDDNSLENRKQLFISQMKGRLKEFYSDWGDVLDTEETDDALSHLFKDIAPIAYFENQIHTDFDEVAIIKLLFTLYHNDNSDKLGEGISSDRVFGFEKGLTVTNDFKRIFKNLYSI